MLLRLLAKKSRTFRGIWTPSQGLEQQLRAPGVAPRRLPHIILMASEGHQAARIRATLCEAQGLYTLGARSERPSVAGDLTAAAGGMFSVKK